MYLKAPISRIRVDVSESKKPVASLRNASVAAKRTKRYISWQVHIFLLFEKGNTAAPGALNQEIDERIYDIRQII